MRLCSTLACCSLLFLAGGALRGHDPITTKLTWTQEISRIVYKRCGSCHHEGGRAMSLTGYSDARPWAKAIRDEVLARRMPPWGAVKGIGEFAGDPTLSQPEIDMLVSWVEGGAPEGDPVFLPPHLPSFAEAAVQSPHSGRSLAVSGVATLVTASTLVAIRPQGLPEGGSLEAWANMPDGSVVRLIWVRDYRRARARSFVLLKPLRLPAGTKLHVAAEAGDAVFLFGA